VAIGEDLGTVEPWLRTFLAEHNVLGTSMLWFERRADGTPRSPRSWRRGCLATVGTHDMPPAAAFLTGEQVTIRAALGLLTRPEAEERQAATADLDQFLSLLARQGLLPATAPGTKPTAAEFTTALYRFLTRTPAVLIGVSLAVAASGSARSSRDPVGYRDDAEQCRLGVTALMCPEELARGGVELRVRHRLTDQRAAVPGQIRLPVLGVLAEVRHGQRRPVAEVPLATRGS
jgi:4-alpha-glucanotransferase